MEPSCYVDFGTFIWKTVQESEVLIKFSAYGQVIACFLAVHSFAFCYHATVRETLSYFWTRKDKINAPGRGDCWTGEAWRAWVYTPEAIYIARLEKEIDASLGVSGADPIQEGTE